MDPASAVASVVVPPLQKWLGGRISTVLLVPTVLVAWLVIAGFSAGTDVLSVVEVALRWLGLGVPDLLTQTAAWLRAPHRGDVVEIAAAGAGVLAALSGQGSPLAGGRGGQVGWLLIALASLVLDTRVAVGHAVVGALGVLAFFWVISWIERIPSSSASPGTSTLLGPGAVVLRWAQGLFETVMLPFVPLVLVFWWGYQAFSVETIAARPQQHPAPDVDGAPSPPHRDAPRPWLVDTTEEAPDLRAG